MHFEVTFRPSTDCVFEILRDLLATLSSCRKLELKLLNKEGQHITVQDVRSICGVLPCRGVEVDIDLGRYCTYRQTGQPKALKQ